MVVTEVEVLIAQAAYAMINDSQFLASWNRLHARCSYATGFQAPSFVCTWYEIYRSQWQPIIIRAMDKNGELIGLWLLACDHKRHMLVHAGAHQAEYHVWLAMPEVEVSFLAAAWPEIQRQTLAKTLNFKYLPTTSLMSTLNAVAEMKNCLSVQIHDRPLAILDAADIKNSFTKKSNKSRFNRLKKLGELEFRKINNLEEFKQVFDDIMTFYDLRQGGINHVTPFHDDPLKREFYIALFAASNEPIVTVTYLNNKAIAAFWGTVSQSTIHLGMLIHSPFLAEHSPGKLHVMQLSEYLLNSEKKILDLTPGGDLWKERFANSHDKVATATLYSKAALRKRAEIVERLLKATKRCIGFAGLEPDDLRRTVRKLRRIQLASLLGRLKNWISTTKEYRVYRAEPKMSVGSAADPRVTRNTLEDLLFFEPGESWQTRDNFLSNALARIENGASLYTVRIGERLAHFGWMTHNQSSSYMTEVQQSMIFPTGSVALFDFYTHPDFRGQGLYRATLASMLRDVDGDTTVKHCYISVLADNLPSRHVIEMQGFQYQGSFYWKKSFGAITKWADAVFSQRGNSDA